MVNYENAVIYKICCKDPTITDNYIGSTTDYKNIKINHKSNCNNQYSRYHIDMFMSLFVSMKAGLIGEFL